MPSGMPKFAHPEDSDRPREMEPTSGKTPVRPLRPVVILDRPLRPHQIWGHIKRAPRYCSGPHRLEIGRDTSGSGPGASGTSPVGPQRPSRRSKVGSSLWLVGFGLLGWGGGEVEVNDDHCPDLRASR
ncbi:hypothetical protein WN48_01694 [Eufriesea mexicana]|uniref:Uncharacterized protein n=1 Tax=Eufriesea mexicana TaxID=516756 RepID=A0A310SGA2_9HYME|nr:hypothetical protein WN48_01694 [Eufriesea mexicana]